VPDLRPDGIPDEVCTVIERAMSRDPGERFVSAAEFGAALCELQRLAGEDVDAMPIPAVLRTPSPSGFSRQALQPRSRGTYTPPPSALTSTVPPPPPASWWRVLD
jgi:serine/threonine-protein kinase PknK